MLYFVCLDAFFYYHDVIMVHVSCSDRIQLCCLFMWLSRKSIWLWTSITCVLTYNATEMTQIINLWKRADHENMMIKGSLGKGCLLRATYAQLSSLMCCCWAPAEVRMWLRCRCSMQEMFQTFCVSVIDFINKRVDSMQTGQRKPSVKPPHIHWVRPLLLR